TIDLHRGDAEVEQDRVRLHAVFRELFEHDSEVAAQEPRLHGRTLREPVEELPRSRVAIDRNQLAATLQLCGEDGRVAPRAEGRVDNRLARLDGEELPDLVGEDGDVISRVWLQDVRPHPQHSLRLRPVL